MLGLVYNEWNIVKHSYNNIKYVFIEEVVIVHKNGTPINTLNVCISANNCITVCYKFIKYYSTDYK